MQEVLCKKGVGQVDQRVRQVKLVVLTVLSLTLSREAGLAEEGV